MSKDRTMDDPICRETVGDLYPPNPIMVPATTPVGEVIELMQVRRVGAILLESDGLLVGVFSERDVVTRVLGSEIDPKTPVNTIVAQDPVYVRTTDHVDKAIGLMAERGIRHLPVCSDQLEIEGILSVRQIIDCLAQHHPMEVMNRPPAPGLVPQAPEGG